MLDQDKFAILTRPRRIWAVPAIHGEPRRLDRLHRRMAERFEIGDRLIYLGNVVGRGSGSVAAIDKLLRFRRVVIAGPGMFASDVAVLRGAQEEMWQKLLQLQLAFNPAEVLEWMLDQGVAATIEAYGGDPQVGLRAARSGAAAIARWTGALSAAIRRASGHAEFMTGLRRAACTEPGPGGARLLFVHAGLDPSRPLAAQGDGFWWDDAGFGDIDRPYGGFAKVVRGFDRRHPGVGQRDFTLSLDAGCGFGGPLLGVCLSEAGEILDLLEA